MTTFTTDVENEMLDSRAVIQPDVNALRAGGQLFLCELHPFRQARGAQAHFTERSTGETVKVPAFPHTTDEFVDTAAVAGFVLRDMGQWMDGNAPSDDPPRLLSLLFDRG